MIQGVLRTRRRTCLRSSSAGTALPGYTGRPCRPEPPAPTPPALLRRRSRRRPRASTLAPADSKTLEETVTHVIIINMLSVSVHFSCSQRNKFTI